jgi:hypothetical protein
MDLKKVAVLSALVSSLSLGTVGAALADNPTPTPNATAAARGAERLSDVQSRSDREISRRVDVVNKLIARLNSDTKLIDSDKTLLMNEDQAALSSLNALKAKIDADTTVADARTDEATLPTIHVYDFIVPQNQRLITVDNLMTLASKTGTSLATIQAKVTNLQNQGNDMSAIQTLLTDANNKLLAINGQLTIDQKELTSLTPTSSNNVSTFAQVRQDFVTMRTDFNGIKSDLVKTKANAQAMKKSATPAPTATP